MGNNMTYIFLAISLGLLTYFFTSSSNRSELPYSSISTIHWIDERGGRQSDVILDMHCSDEHSIVAQCPHLSAYPDLTLTSTWVKALEKEFDKFNREFFDLQNQEIMTLPLFEERYGVKKQSNDDPQVNHIEIVFKNGETASLHLGAFNLSLIHI